jgi:hypothetical protein
MPKVAIPRRTTAVPGKIWFLRLAPGLVTRARYWWRLLDHLWVVGDSGGHQVAVHRRILPSSVHQYRRLDRGGVARLPLLGTVVQVTAFYAASPQRGRSTGNDRTPHRGDHQRRHRTHGYPTAHDEEGGLLLRNGDRLVPDLLLVGRHAGRLKGLAAANGNQRWATSLDEALAGPDAIFMDCAATGDRPDRGRQSPPVSTFISRSRPLRQ